jgi:hypothetical protein
MRGGQGAERRIEETGGGNEGPLEFRMKDEGERERGREGGRLGR